MYVAYFCSVQLIHLFCIYAFWTQYQQVVYKVLNTKKITYYKSPSYSLIIPHPVTA